MSKDQKRVSGRSTEPNDVAGGKRASRIAAAEIVCPRHVTPDEVNAMLRYKTLFEERPLPQSSPCPHGGGPLIC